MYIRNVSWLHFTTSVQYVTMISGEILFIQNMNQEHLQKHLIQKEHLHKNMHLPLFGIFRELG